jgi:hypothetical protein
MRRIATPSASIGKTGMGHSFQKNGDSPCTS